MKLEAKLRSRLIFELKQLEKKDKNSIMIEILKIFTAESATEEQVKDEIKRLWQMVSVYEPLKDISDASMLPIYTPHSSLPPQYSESDVLIAIWLLGICHHEGIVVAKNPETAVELLKFGAKKNSPHSQSYLGYSYLQGIGVHKDKAQAILLFQLSAQQKYAPGMNNLAANIENIEDTIYYLLSGVDQRHPNSLINLAFQYTVGKVVNVDEYRAFDLYIQSTQCTDLQGIEQGFISFYFMRHRELQEKRICVGYLKAKLQKMGHEFVGRPFIYREEKPDFGISEAFTQYSKQNNNGMLGFCCQFGIGISQDLKKAREYYSVALRELDGRFWDFYYNCQMTDSEIDKDEMEKFKIELERAKEIAIDLKTEDETALLRVLRFKKEAIKLVAYCYEWGALGYEINLFKALEFYEQLKVLEELINKKWDPKEKLYEISDTDKTHVHYKLEKFSTLRAFELKVKEGFPASCSLNGSLQSLVVQYAFEPNIPAPKRHWKIV